MGENVFLYRIESSSYSFLVLQNGIWDKTVDSSYLLTSFPAWLLWTQSLRLIIVYVSDSSFDASFMAQLGQSWSFMDLHFNTVIPVQVAHVSR